MNEKDEMKNEELTDRELIKLAIDSMMERMVAGPVTQFCSSDCKDIDCRPASCLENGLQGDYYTRYQQISEKLAKKETISQFFYRRMGEIMTCSCETEADFAIGREDGLVCDCIVCPSSISDMIYEEVCELTANEEVTKRLGEIAEELSNLLLVSPEEGYM